MNKLGLLLIAGLTAGAPAAGDDRDILVLSKDWFTDKIYTSDHDIVYIFAPEEALKVRNDTDYDYDTDHPIRVHIIFFVQGDYKDDGTVDNKGLFAFNIRTREVTKLLDNGVDGTAAKGENRVFIAATDGIYVYNPEKNTTEKYGSLTDNVISIAKARKSDIIYALTADKVLYKVTENGEKKEKVDAVKNAQQIILNEKDNLLFYNSEKNIYIVTENGVKKIEGRPENPKKITLLKPIRKYAPSPKYVTPVMIDDKIYQIDKNGLERPLKVAVLQPTALCLTNYGIFFGYMKSIYENHF